MASPVFDDGIFDAAIFGGSGELFCDGVFDPVIFDTLTYVEPPVDPDPPSGGGVTGGYSWLRGYVPKYGYEYVPTPTASQQDRRDEILLMLPH